MAGYEPDTITLRVRKGIRVNVEEVDDAAEVSLDREQSDRDAHLAMPLDLKVAMQRVPDGPERAEGAVRITMCG
jgi:hypothetical protein